MEIADELLEIEFEEIDAHDGLDKVESTYDAEAAKEEPEGADQVETHGANHKATAFHAEAAKTTNHVRQ